jgi:DNA-binding Lrp family transcriptional regulator
VTTSLDWRVYCELYRQTPDPLWGLFPHPSVNAIAKRLGITRGTVWRRLIEWQKIGFLKGFEIIPNPTLLGVGLRTYKVKIPDLSARRHFLEELEYIDGMVSALVQIGADADLVTISDIASARKRREELLTRIEGVASITPGLAMWVPSCARNVSLDEWHFISGLRTNPTISLGKLADKLGISAKTASRRYTSLRKDCAILGYAAEDFSKFPGVVAGSGIILNPKADPRPVTLAIENDLPDALELRDMTQAPGGHSSTLAYLQLIRVAPEVDAISTLKLPGVARVEKFFPGAEIVYRHWFDERIAEVLARHGA